MGTTKHLHSDTYSASDTSVSVLPEELAGEVKIEGTEKLRELFLYVVQQVGHKPNVVKTVINKLLYFIDFGYYAKHSESVTVSAYLKMPYGPVPQFMDHCIDELKRESRVEEKTKEYGNYRQIKFHALEEAQMRWADFAMEHINETLERLSGKTAYYLTQFSHNELPYLRAKDRDILDYNLAFYRSAKQKEVLEGADSAEIQVLVRVNAVIRQFENKYDDGEIAAFALKEGTKELKHYPTLKKYIECVAEGEYNGLEPILESIQSTDLAAALSGVLGGLMVINESYYTGMASIYSFILGEIRDNSAILESEATQKAIRLLSPKDTYKNLLEFAIQTDRETAVRCQYLSFAGFVSQFLETAFLKSSASSSSSFESIDTEDLRVFGTILSRFIIQQSLIFSDVVEQLKGFLEKKGKNDDFVEYHKKYFEHALLNIRKTKASMEL